MAAAGVFAGRDAFVRDFIGQAAALTGEHNPFEMHSRRTTIESYSAVEEQFAARLPVSYCAAYQKALALRVEESARPIFIYNEILRGLAHRRLPSVTEAADLKCCDLIKRLPLLRDFAVDEDETPAETAQRMRAIIRQHLADNHRISGEAMEQVLPFMDEPSLQSQRSPNDYSSQALTILLRLKKSEPEAQLRALREYCAWRESPEAVLPPVVQEMLRAVPLQGDSAETLYRLSGQAEPAFVKILFSQCHTARLVARVFAKSATCNVVKFYDSMAHLFTAVTRANCSAAVVTQVKIALVITSIVCTLLGMVEGLVGLALLYAFHPFILPALLLGFARELMAWAMGSLVLATLPLLHLIGLVVAVVQKDHSFVTNAFPANAIIHNPIRQRMIA